MKHLNKQAKKIMDQLTEGLNGTARKIDNSKSFMAVHVEQVRDTPMGPVYAVTHFYEQNGDLMHDPDMTFLKGFTGDFAVCGPLMSNGIHSLKDNQAKGIELY